jgi:CRISPR-associated protein Csb2
VTTTLQVKYIVGRVHGTPWGVSHNEGAIEYPPSPWRISRALIATWFERAHDIPEPTVRSLIKRLNSALPIYRTPTMSGAHMRHYFPDSDHKLGVAGGTAKVLDTFASVNPDEALIIQWPVDLATDEHATLVRLAALLPYLGRAESLVSAELVDHATLDRSEQNIDAVIVQPGVGAGLNDPQFRLLSATQDSTFEQLLEVPWKLRAKGYVTPPATVRSSYTAAKSLERISTVSRRHARPKVTLIEWSLKGRGRVPVTASVAYCEVLRRAVLSKVGSRIPDAGWVVTGKENDAKSTNDHQHAHFLPVEREGFLEGVAAWFPSGIDANVLERIGLITELNQTAREGARDFRPVRLFLAATSETPDRAVMLDVRPASVWETVTPYAPSRHPRYDGRFLRSLTTLVQRDLAEGPWGLTEEIQIELTPDVLPHPLDFRRHRLSPKEFLADGRRAFHLRITFPSAVSGPISLGALSHFGLGSFRPVRSNAK